MQSLNNIEKSLSVVALMVCVLVVCSNCERSRLKVEHMVQPDYPVPARSGNIEGTVELGIIIGMDGKVTDAHGSGANPILVEAAEENARQWIWGPFPAKFSFPHYQEIYYTYKLVGKARPVVVVPPIVNIDLPGRIEIIATPYHSDLEITPVPSSPSK